MNRMNPAITAAPSRPSLLAALLAVALLASFTVGAFPREAVAHGPSEVVISYEAAEGTLSATIVHAVSDPSRHYISEIVITKNGEVLKRRQYTSQPDPVSFTYRYALEAEAGDGITLSARCNRFGSGSASMTIAGETR